MSLDVAGTLEDGRISSEAVEINAVWHCNIRCRWCSHGSPLMPTRIADAQVVNRNLNGLAKWMRVDHVRVLGGEPLLHPQLPELLSAIRASGIADRVRIVTNGLALHKMPSETWSLIDEIHVSVYPNTERAIQSRISTIQSAAFASHTSLVLKVFDHFRVSYRAAEADKHLTQRIYETCQIGNVWRCLTVEDGCLYRCPQSAFLESFANPRSSSHSTGRDGLVIEEIRSVDEVRSWMIQGAPLLGCRTCAGSVGVREPHQQLSPHERVRSAVNQSPFIIGPEDVLDYDYLSRLERDKNADNDCMSHSSVLA